MKSATHLVAWLIAVAYSGLPGATAEAAAVAPSQDTVEPADPRASLLRFQVEEILIPTTAGTSLSIPLLLDGSPCELQLEAHSLRADDFRVLVQDDLGKLSEAALPPAQTYRGEIGGHSGTRVAATIADGRLSAVILLGDGSRWYVQPMVDPAGGPSQSIAHIVYQARDVVEQPHQCGVGDNSAGPDIATVSENGIAGPAGPMRICDIAFDADFEFYQANGSSVPQTVHDIENVLNGVSLLYESELNIAYELTTVIVRDSAVDPYTSSDSSTLLGQFRSEWNVHMLQVHRDIAHLMTGRNLNNSIIGLAYRDSMCEVCAGADGYGLSRSRFSPLMSSRICVTAHEIGHNWGACHCDDLTCTGGVVDTDCGVMCSQLGGCAGTCTRFGARSLATINATASSAVCLSTLSPPLPFPLCETFESGLNSATWSYNAASTLSTDAINPPSPPNVLRIDNCCTECDNAPDEIRTNFIRLGGVNGASLLFQSQHAGGFASLGSQLVVDYWSNSQSWIELLRVVSNGLDQTDFDAWAQVLPADALHDEARIRFRLVAASNEDVWYLDDVAVVRAPIESAILHVRQGVASSGGGTSWKDAYADLQDALVASACAGGVVEEIWVSSGTYKPDRGTGDRSASFRLLNGIALLGGFAGTETAASERDPRMNRTELNGDIGITGIASDDAYHVVTGSATNASAVLEGFTISGGRAFATPGDGGGGLRVVGGSPTISNCVFAANSGNNGGGIYVGSNSFPRFAESTVVDNEAFSSGGGLYVAPGGQPYLDRCRFLGNFAMAFGGGIHNATGRVDLLNTVVSGNIAASSGGGVYNQQFGNLTFQACTISLNVASGSVGGIVNSPNAIAIVNSTVLWGNRDSNGMLQSSQIAPSAPVLNYSCVQGLTGSLGGVGNTGADPLFVDADGADDTPGTVDDDLRLASASPAMNAGDPSSTPGTLGPADLDGHPRILCGRVDMGALEFGVGDYNCDRTVNLSDFADWSACMTGPAGGAYAPPCAAFDFNVDNHVDLHDFAEFQRVINGQ